MHARVSPSTVWNCAHSEYRLRPSRVLSECERLSVVISCSILEVLYWCYLTSHFLSPLLFSPPWLSALVVITCAFVYRGPHVRRLFYLSIVRSGSCRCCEVFLSLFGLLVLRIWILSPLSGLITCLWPVSLPLSIKSTDQVLCTSTV